MENAKNHEKLKQPDAVSERKTYKELYSEYEEQINQFAAFAGNKENFVLMLNCIDYPELYALTYEEKGDLYYHAICCALVKKHKWQA